MAVWVLELDQGERELHQEHIGDSANGDLLMMGMWRYRKRISRMTGYGLRNQEHGRITAEMWERGGDRAGGKPQNSLLHRLSLRGLSGM